MRRRTQLKDASEKAAENASENSAVNNTGGGLTSISLKIIHPLSMILFHSPIATCNSLPAGKIVGVTRVAPTIIHCGVECILLNINIQFQYYKKQYFL